MEATKRMMHRFPGFPGVLSTTTRNRYLGTSNVHVQVRKKSASYLCHHSSTSKLGKIEIIFKWFKKKTESSETTHVDALPQLTLTLI
jgi:hypothetical protein